MPLVRANDLRYLLAGGSGFALGARFRHGQEKARRWRGPASQVHALYVAFGRKYHAIYYELNITMTTKKAKSNRNGTTIIKEKRIMFF